jgi:2-polyprenyl-3-methyl-5-hydroxy-6-metoxy-1,4-benzoquinol methylase
LTGAQRDNEAYWLERHRRLQHKLAAVGDISSSEERNLELYARKKRRVADLLRELCGLDLTGLSALDAGCGVGMISELLYVLGADVSGVDASPVAIDEARHRCPAGDFRSESLLDFRFQKRFDLTLCIDVLYHVVDDQNWLVVLGNLIAHTKPGGHLVILDQHKDDVQSPASHVRFRTKSLYRDAMSEADVDDVTPPDQEVFLVYRVEGEPGKPPSDPSRAGRQTNKRSR